MSGYESNYEPRPEILNTATEIKERDQQNKKPAECSAGFAFTVFCRFLAL